MTMAQEMFGNVLKKGEEIFQSVSGKLLEKPAVAKAFEAAMVGKSKVDQGVATALKRLNVQTRSEFRGLRARVDGLEMQVAELREAIEGLKSASPKAAPAKTPATAPARARARKPAKKA
jgi:polyhydroxyalkanoate synthesis regulator phasin